MHAVDEKGEIEQGEGPDAEQQVVSIGAARLKPRLSKITG